MNEQLIKTLAKRSALEALDDAKAVRNDVSTDYDRDDAQQAIAIICAGFWGETDMLQSIIYELKFSDELRQFIADISDATTEMIKQYVDPKGVNNDSEKQEIVSMIKALA